VKSPPAVLPPRGFPARELARSIEHAFILCRGNIIAMDHLPFDLKEDFGRLPSPPGAWVNLAKSLKPYSGFSKRSSGIKQLLADYCA
jgi:hypothetical protein